MADVFTVEAIVGHKWVNSDLRFRVRWAGYGQEDDTWEPKAHILDKKLLREFSSDSGVEISDIEDEDEEEVEDEEEADDEFEVEEVLACRFAKGKLEYLIKWAAKDGEEAQDPETWEPAAAFSVEDWPQAAAFWERKGEAPPPQACNPARAEARAAAAAQPHESVFARAAAAAAAAQQHESAAASGSSLPV